ncbi:hypothetical protein [Microbacterium sp. AG238]|uniref:hypothetical protein n=1 Tax=Microbacterium sp. AG238 TaxID=2183994 RepID=UPI000E74FDC5|nr:hypothetical protein [Microbacterium sp. AG238]RKE62928.1 hypothetical protein DEU36_0118 [Microbacterium sp. AG238]
MTALDIEIAAARAAAAARKRLARLREKQRRDRVRFDARVLAILRSRLRPADLAVVETEARTQLGAEAAESSHRALAARQGRATS